MKAFAAAIALLGLGSFAGPAHAGTSHFAGTLAVRIGDLGSASAKGTGIATLNQMAGGTHVTTLTVPGSLSVAGAFTLSPTQEGITQISLTAHMTPGTWSGIVPGSSMSTFGALLGSATGPGFFRLRGPGGTLTLSHAVGAASFTESATAGPPTFTSAVTVTIHPAAWTVAVAHGPASAASTVALGNSTLPGVLQFVTPTSITSNLSLPSSITHTLTYRLVPEPGMALLLLSGVGGLLALGLRRRKR